MNDHFLSFVRCALTSCPYSELLRLIFNNGRIFLLDIRKVRVDQNRTHRVLLMFNPEMLNDRFAKKIGFTTRASIQLDSFTLRDK